MRGSWVYPDGNVEVGICGSVATIREREGERVAQADMSQSAQRWRNGAICMKVEFQVRDKDTAPTTVCIVRYP
jgi:hypothetical protein